MSEGWEGERERDRERKVSVLRGWEGEKEMSVLGRHGNVNFISAIVKTDEIWQGGYTSRSS